MSTKLVRAIKSFDHYGFRKRGAEFPVSSGHAKQLKDKGLVIIVGETDRDPIQPAGRVLLSSASPAGQASPLTTSSSSTTGDSPDEESESEPVSEEVSEVVSEPPAPPPLKPWQARLQKKRR